LDADAVVEAEEAAADRAERPPTVAQTIAGAAQSAWGADTATVAAVLGDRSCYRRRWRTTKRIAENACVAAEAAAVAGGPPEPEPEPEPVLELVVDIVVGEGDGLGEDSSDARDARGARGQLRQVHHGGHRHAVGGLHEL
jgi:hypothetical protein